MFVITMIKLGQKFNPSLTKAMRNGLDPFEKTDGAYAAALPVTDTAAAGGGISLLTPSSSSLSLEQQPLLQDPPCAYT